MIITSQDRNEKVVLIGLAFGRQSEEQVREYLEELSLLAHTAGARPVKKFIQKLEHPNPTTFIGSGKMTEIRDYVLANGVNLVIFDDELSPSQVRNIERILNPPIVSWSDGIIGNFCRVADRNTLILDIFARRAHTAHARAQVALAQYEYMLPRLTGLWTHLERQKGGIGLRGPGEREIETDRRIIRDKIAHLKEELSRIDRQKATQRSNRGKLVRVALVGYTNAGKSTLMNVFSKAGVFAEDKLFATLDTTVRKVVIGNLPFLLADTVGFIRKLPHQLIESFKSTLDEVREADILLHVVDVSHPNFEEQFRVAGETLAEIDACGKPMLTVFNKTDLYRKHQEIKEVNQTGDDVENSIAVLRKSWMSKENDPCIFISAEKQENIEELRRTLYEIVKKIHVQRYPYDDFLY